MCVTSAGRQRFLTATCLERILVFSELETAHFDHIYPSVLIVNRCNPYFVRCIKPNHLKVNLEVFWCVQVCRGFSRC